MIKYVKTFTVLAFISVGVSFVLFLFLGNSNPTVHSFEITYGEKNQTKGPSQPGGMFNEIAAQASKVLGITLPNQNSTGYKFSDGLNLTEIFGKIMSDNIIQGNPNGSQMIDGQDSLIVPGSLDLTNPSLGQDFQFFKKQITSPEVDASRFNIINTTKKVDLRNYFWTLEGSFAQLHKNSGFIMKPQNADDAMKNYQITDVIFEKYLKTLYSMPVPAIFKDFHIRAVRASEIQKRIADTVLDYQNDPLKALWMQSIQQDLNNEAKDITKQEVALIQEYGLDK